MTALLLLLGGTGSRFGGSVPKQFIDVTDGNETLPLFEITARRLLFKLEIDLLVLVVPEVSGSDAALRAAVERLTAKYAKCDFRVTSGGATRHKSFLSGLSQVRLAKRVEKLLVHDANRPYLSDKYLDRISGGLADLSARNQAFIPVIPVVDSVVRTGAGTVLGYEDRSTLARVQTPQLIHWPSLSDALSDPKSKDILTGDFTDEGSLCKALQLEVRTLEGDVENVKITFPSDLKA
jgi:2-C-methyl-D-erythritol 4-phosphate cytidylyltransferase / 2-C-methyl-D-erythritol 2,4-cyclodiphosphate synthase